MTHTPKPAFYHTSGPRNAKILIVGEAFGQQEERIGYPFVGTSGQELTRMLSEAGIRRQDCLLTNVLPLRPRDNKIEALCGTKAEVGKDYPYPPIGNGKYLLPEYLPEMARLREEILTCNPNLVIALGNIACWALLGMPKITAIRGTAAAATLCVRPGGQVFKVIPTFHPAYVLRAWQDRVIVIADLTKALLESVYPEIKRPEREVLVDPTLAEIEAWLRLPAEAYACDIETFQGQIEMIGFARSASDAIVIPFIDRRKLAEKPPTYNYWSRAEDEVVARGYAQQLLSGPVPKIFQNGLFDMQYLLREGFKLWNVLDDTMLLHHAIFPEIKKGLGFLGSIYTSEASWKLLRNEDSLKREE